MLGKRWVPEIQYTKGVLSASHYVHSTTGRKPRIQCNGSASVESETRDFRLDSDHSVNSGLLFTICCLALASCLSFSFPSYPRIRPDPFLSLSPSNDDSLEATPNCDNVDSRVLRPLSPFIQTTPFQSFQHRLYHYPRPTGLEPAF